MLKLLLLILCCAPLMGQIAISAEAGVGGVVSAPCTEARILINKGEPRPFVGRIVIDLGEPTRMRRGRRPGFAGEVQVTRDLSLEEGTFSRVMHMDVPVGSVVLSAEVRLERQVSGSFYESIAATQIDEPVRDTGRKLIGFVSAARIAAASRYFWADVAEIPVADLPESWKALAGFDAIVLNDDRITRAQSDALVNYMAMGGTVLLSPQGNGSFNPETPAGSLLKIAATVRSRKHVLRDFPELSHALELAGPGALPLHEEAPDPSEPPPVREDKPLGPAVEPEMPALESEVVFWPEAGRARPVPGTQGLVSQAPVGAGNFVLLHVNVSAPPFVAQDNAPTTAGVNLLRLAMIGVQDRTGRSPFLALADDKVRNQIDIAGHRIPSREAQVLLLLLYVSVAGVGMFLLARRLRRPELYPAALLAAALVSVGLVFSFGEIYKRGGDRVKAARILVTDETTDRAAVFTMGCGYAVDGESMTYRQSLDSLMRPTRFQPGMGRRGAVADDVYDFNASQTATELATTVTGLDRWQNVFFMQRQPLTPSSMKARVERFDGAWRVTNLSPYRLEGCVLIVGGPQRASTDAQQRSKWLYAPAIDAQDSFTFSASTDLGSSAEALSNSWENDLAEESAFKVAANFLNIDPDDRILKSRDLQQVEAILWTAGLLPEDGEFVLICVLPADALDPSTIGAEGVDDSRVGQVNLWVVRGALENR